MRTTLAFALAVAGLTACGASTRTIQRDEDLGPIDDTIDFADRVHWPGVDTAAGREVLAFNGFGEGRPAAFWLLGHGSRGTADSYWFCREDEEDCPLDPNRRLSWDRLAGRPVFTRIPGRGGFSPHWQMWKVTVPASYEPDLIKTAETVDRAVDEGLVQVEPFVVDFGERVGRREVVVHCPLVLSGTTLTGNGELMPDGEAPMTSIQTQLGWYAGYRVELFDFSVSDGVLAAADDSKDRPLMRVANMYLLWRECAGGPEVGVCAIRPDDGAALVSERDADLTGDGDTNDTNHTVGGIPCRKPLLRDHPSRPDEPAYSPLWAVHHVLVTSSASPGVGLIDTYGDQRQSDIRSVVDMFARVDAGELEEPELRTEDWDGNPLPDDAGPLFSSSPIPVAEGHVPFPCSDDE